jgi:hypothetical protein
MGYSLSEKAGVFVPDNSISWVRSEPTTSGARAFLANMRITLISLPMKKHSSLFAFDGW